MTQNFECTYQSFEPLGSIYTSNLLSRNFQDKLRHLNIKAVIDLSPYSKVQSDSPEEFYVLNLPTQIKESIDLKKSFQSSFEFICKNRCQTNILIFAEHPYLCYVFLFAYLMRKYNYTLAHVYKLYDNKSKNIRFPPEITDQLRRIPYLYDNQPKEDKNSLLKDSKIGRRIRRIQFEYTNLSKNSRSSSRVSKDENQFNYQSVKPVGFDFFAQKCQLGFDELSPIQIKLNNRHVKRLSDFY